jgi:predicted nucleic acid-binding Zn ribbon protein
MPRPTQADTPASPLRCRKCGSNRFIVPDKSTDDSLITCADCRAGLGRWGEIRVGILEEAKTEEKGAPGRKAKRRRAAA